jgi:peptide/nickel transport system substrate-binding protein
MRLTLGCSAMLATPALGGILEACTGSSGQAPKPGGTVRFAISSDPKVLNPPVHTLAIESLVMSLLFPGLVRMNGSGNLVPDLASSYRVEDGGLTYRFQLRGGLEWQDGRPLTSADLLFTYRTYVDPRTATAYLLGWDKIDRVETPDARTVVYRLKEAFAPFLLAVGGNAVLPEHVLGGTRDIRKDPFNRAPVGCGPFRLTSWQTASQIVLEANPHYWRGRPQLDRFVFTIVPDAVTQVDQLQAGEVDVIGVTATLWDQVKGLAPRIATASYDDLRYALVQLDEYGFLKEAAVRRALDYATPKQEIVKSLLRGLATPARADVPPSSFYYQPNVEHHDYNLDRARSLLRQAGFTVQGGVMTRDGRALEVPIYTISTSPTYVQVAQVLQDSWSKVGVRTGVTGMDASTLFSNQGPQWNGKDAALIYSWSPGADPYNYVNWSSNQIPNNEADPGDNGGRYVNPAIDRLVVEGAQVTDPGRRRQVYDQIQQVLAHDVPAIFLYWPKALYAFNARLHGFRPNALAGILAGASGWTLAS